MGVMTTYSYDSPKTAVSKMLRSFMPAFLSAGLTTFFCKSCQSVTISGLTRTTEIDVHCWADASAIGLSFLAAGFLGAAFGAVVVWATASNAVIVIHRARLTTLQAVLFIGFLQSCLVAVLRLVNAP